MRPEKAHGQAIGADLVNWAEPPFPDPIILTGRSITLEPLSWEQHGPGLWGS